MAQAKITISREQAQKLGLLTIHTKTKSFMLYDPKSGITLRETKAGETITVPDGANTYNLERFLASGYFTVAEGTLSQTANPYLSSIKAFTAEEPIEEIGVLTPEFDREETEYVLVLPHETTAVPAIVSRPDDAGATVELTDADDLSGKTVIVVTAEDGVITKTYTISFIVDLSVDNADLSDLKLDGATIDGFAPERVEYNIELLAGTSVAPLATATSADADAQVEVTNAAELPGSTEVIVTAEDGTTIKVYTISFTVAEE